MQGLYVSVAVNWVTSFKIMMKPIVNFSSGQKISNKIAGRFRVTH